MVQVSSRSEQDLERDSQILTLQHTMPHFSQFAEQKKMHSQVISFGLTPGASYGWFWGEPDVLRGVSDLLHTHSYLEHSQ